MAGPSRPAVTAPQIAGILMAGIPFIVQLLHALGLYEVTPEQQAAISNVVQWAAISAGTLFSADAALRAARNHAHAKVAQAQTYKAQATPVPAEAPSSPSEVTETPEAAQTPIVKPKPRKRPATPVKKAVIASKVPK